MLPASNREQKFLSLPKKNVKEYQKRGIEFLEELLVFVEGNNVGSSGQRLGSCFRMEKYVEPGKFHGLRYENSFSLPTRKRLVFDSRIKKIL